MVVVDKGSLEANLESIFLEMDKCVKETVEHDVVKGLVMDIGLLAYDTFEILKEYKKQGIKIPMTVPQVLTKYKEYRDSLKLKQA